MAEIFLMIIWIWIQKCLDTHKTMGKQSPIWNFFNKTGKSTSNKCQRDCEAKGGNTNNLSSHLRVRNPKLYVEFCHQKMLDKKS